MTDIQAWLDRGKAHATVIADGPWTWNEHDLEVQGPIKPSRNGRYATMNAHASCNDDLDGEFIADARTRLPQALNALQAVLDTHHDDGDGLCNECSDRFLATHHCPTVRAIQDAIGEHDE